MISENISIDSENHSKSLKVLLGEKLPSWKIKSLASMIITSGSIISSYFWISPQMNPENE